MKNKSLYALWITRNKTLSFIEYSDSFGRHYLNGGDIMPDYPFNDPNTLKYFSSLPSMIKESIIQSGVKFNSVDELQAFVDNLNQQS